MTKNKAKNDGMVLSLKNDFLFKVVYGSDTEESKTVLMALLNLILHREEDPIIDIEYKNPFQYRQYFDEKETILDIKVTTSSGDLIDIEMQLICQEDLRERFITYHGGLIRESLSRGEAYGTMKTTITIGIVDAVFLEDEDFLNEFYFINRKSQALFSERSYICCIELPKVNREKKPIEELTPLELCLEYLKHADENGSEYVDALIQRGGKELQMAQEMLRKATEDEILREQAIAREKFANDMASIRYNMARRDKRLAEQDKQLAEQEKQLAEKNKQLDEMEFQMKEVQQILQDTQKIHEKELSDGIHEGRSDERLRIAANLKAAGIPATIIAESTGLSEGEINMI